MTIDSEWASDIDEMVEDLPNMLVVVSTGQSVSGTASHINRTDDVANEGVLNLANLEWHGKRSLFTLGEPDVRAAVMVDGVGYHVVSRDVDSVGIRLILRRV